MKPRILLIEDNEQNRYLVTFLLESAGAEITQAATGPEGVLLARTAAFDLVLLDIQLPGMDGYAVARALRALPELAAVPILAVTSYAMVGDRERALAAGCDAYFEKPIDPSTFAREVLSHLGSRAREGPA